jgi:glycosyltransferase involved in cell wall biosynthesis
MKTVLDARVLRHETCPEASKHKKVCLLILRPLRSDVRSMRDATALMQAGYDVLIIDVEEERCPTWEEAQGVPVHHIIVKQWRAVRRLEPLFFLKAFQAFLISLFYLLRADADVYHACEITAILPCYIAAKLRRKPLIYEAYELPLHDVPLSEMGTMRKFVHRLFSGLFPRLISACAAVITVSPPIVEAIKRTYHLEHVALVRNILPYRTVERTNRMRELLALPSTTRIALYQGYLQPDRGLDVLIQCAPMLDPNIMIVMMGKGVEQPRLEALIQHYHVSERVKIIPPVPYAELLEWTASADIGLTLIPLDYTLNMQWCLPNKLFEYIMAGLPVLSAPLVAISEIITRHGVGRVVPSLSPEVIAAAINTMLADFEGLALMRQNALISAKELCWENESTQLLNLYEHIGLK